MVDLGHIKVDGGLKAVPFLGGLRGQKELVIRAPAESTGLTRNKARLHTHTQIPTVSLLTQEGTSVSDLFLRSERLSTCVEPIDTQRVW